jgi:hypothetical protein
MKVHLKTFCLPDEGARNLQTTEDLREIIMNIFDENV